MLETPNTIKAWKSWETAIDQTLSRDQYAMLLRTPFPINPGIYIIYWNLQWDIPLGWVSYFKSPVRGNNSVSTGNLMSCCKTVLLKCTFLEWNTCHWKRRESVGPGMVNPTKSAASAGQQVWFVQPGQVPKADITLTSKGEATSVIVIEGE